MPPASRAESIPEAELPPAPEAAPAEAAAPTEPPPAPDAEAPPDPALIAEGVRIAEALIFASDRPVTPAMLAAVLPEGLAATQVVPVLAEACEGRGVTLMEVAGGWAFRTAPDLAMRLTKVVQAPRRLPRAAMEALSIVAYHQPCTRGEIEEIRGAALAQTTLEALLELGLIAPRGRREVPGRPTLWGTTPRFLEQFALKSLTDLPRKEELVTAETGPALPLPGMAPQAELDLPPTEETLPEEPGEARPPEAEETPDEPGPPAPGA
jgi:segregation and condensation protein B